MSQLNCVGELKFLLYDLLLIPATSLRNTYKYGTYNLKSWKSGFWHKKDGETLCSPSNNSYFELLFYLLHSFVITIKIRYYIIATGQGMIRELGLL